MNLTIFMQNIKKFFGYTPVALTGTQTSALTAVGEHFVGIANLLQEGNIAPELCERAYAALYDSKVVVNAAIAQGWGGGKSSGY